MERLQSITGSGDLCFGNLEAPLTVPLNHLRELKPFEGGEEFARVLAESGINVVTVANNHILEHGRSGFDSTLRFLARNGVAAAGVETDDGSSLCLVERKGYRVVFMGFSTVTAPWHPSTYSRLSHDRIEKELARASNLKPDLVVVGVHWGDEYMRVPNRDQQQMGRALVDAGANIVVGHHPHVVQPVEYYNGGLIFYSLGNFIFDMSWSSHVRTGAVATVSYNHQGISHELQPFWIDDSFLPSLGHRNVDRLNSRWAHDFSTTVRRDRHLYALSRETARLLARIRMKVHIIRRYRRLPTETRRSIRNHWKQKLWGTWKQTE